jgi:hypothetical protein
MTLVFFNSCLSFLNYSLFQHILLELQPEPRFRQRVHLSTEHRKLNLWCIHELCVNYHCLPLPSHQALILLSLPLNQPTNIISRSARFPEHDIILVAGPEHWHDNISNFMCIFLNPQWLSPTSLLLYNQDSSAGRRVTRENASGWPQGKIMTWAQISWTGPLLTMFLPSHWPEVVTLNQFWIFARLT